MIQYDRRFVPKEAVKQTDEVLRNLIWINIVLIVILVCFAI